MTLHTLPEQALSTRDILGTGVANMTRNEALRMLAGFVERREFTKVGFLNAHNANVAKTDTEFAGRLETILLKRGPELAEFARTILYLVENRSITGQMIGLDGGQHLAWETPDVAEPDS